MLMMVTLMLTPMMTTNHFMVNDNFSALQNARLNADRRLVSRVRRPNTGVVEHIRVGRSIERADLVKTIRLTRKTPPTRICPHVPQRDQGHANTWDQAVSHGTSTLFNHWREVAIAALVCQIQGIDLNI